MHEPHPAVDFLIIAQGAMLQTIHRHWMAGSSHALSTSQAQQQHSESADIPCGGACRGRAAAAEDAAVRIQAAVRQVLDEKLWPLEALLEQAVGKFFLFNEACMIRLEKAMLWTHPHTCCMLVLPVATLH